MEMWQQTDTEQYRAIQAKYTSAQYNHFSIPGKLITFYYRKKNKKRHTENTTLIHLPQLTHQPTFTLMAIAPLLPATKGYQRTFTAAPWRHRSWEPQKKSSCLKNPSPSMVCTQTLAMNITWQTSQEQEKKTQPREKQKKRTQLVLFYSNFKN